eukprot:scaffold8_cov249-Pinguiococcus_pyrenoidosus.AAC.23
MTISITTAASTETVWDASSADNLIEKFSENVCGGLTCCSPCASRSDFFLSATLTRSCSRSVSIARSFRSLICPLASAPLVLFSGESSGPRSLTDRTLPEKHAAKISSCSDDTAPQAKPRILSPTSLAARRCGGLASFSIDVVTPHVHHSGTSVALYGEAHQRVQAILADERRHFLARRRCVVVIETVDVLAPGPDPVGLDVHEADLLHHGGWQREEVPARLVPSVDVRAVRGKDPRLPVVATAEAEGGHRTTAFGGLKDDSGLVLLHLEAAELAGIIPNHNFLPAAPPPTQHCDRAVT